MSDKIIKYEDIGNNIYDLKIILENTLNIISKTCYKDYRGNYYIPTKIEEINEINDVLLDLITHIENIQNKIKLLD
jgi:hypothetical protein